VYRVVDDDEEVEPGRGKLSTFFRTSRKRVERPGPRNLFPIAKMAISKGFSW